ncbi:MAG: metal-dependent hydrolase [Candidatus Saccharibacteria bacterium]|nr:metal-dependent hydrolase [Candidatus Saccharibacteria bacterium]
MADYKGHVAGGAVFGGFFYFVIAYVPVQRLAETASLLQNWQGIFAIFVISMLFGLFPDVDTNSKAQDMFFAIIFPLDILLLATDKIEAAAYLGLIAMLPIIGHHRGWTHKKWAMIVVPLPILLIPYIYNSEILPISAVYYGAAVSGYFSHLFLDGLIWRKFRIKN